MLGRAPVWLFISLFLLEVRTGGGRGSFTNQTVQLALVGCTCFWPLLSCPVIRKQSFQLKDRLPAEGRSEVLLKEFGPHQWLRHSLSQL